MRTVVVKRMLARAFTTPESLCACAGGDSADPVPGGGGATHVGAW